MQISIRPWTFSQLSRRSRVATRWIIRLLLLAVFAGGLLAGGLVLEAQAQGGDTPTDVNAATVTDYQAVLKAAQTALANGDDDAAALAAARGILAQVEHVRLENGDVVDLSPLLGHDGDGLTRMAAQARLELAARQLAAARSDNTAARMAALQTVLAGPEFTQGESLLDQLRRWLGELWSRWFPERAPDPQANALAETTTTALGWGVIVIVAVAVVWLLVYWLRGLLGNFVADASAKRPNGADSDLPQTPAEARERASEQARAGNYRDAVRNLYLSALLTLETKGVIVPDRSLTNREVLARLQPGNPLRPSMEPVVDTFDEVWYGVREPDDQTYQTYTHAIDELESVAAQAEKAAGKQP